jgi:GNAT superfamily N-acetyltransferase
MKNYITKVPAYYFKNINMEIQIRQMTVEDAAAVNLLSKQLGYPLSLQQTIGNINAVLKSKDHIAFVAVSEYKIIGWIGAAQAIMIEVNPHCEINGLVIHEHYRGNGVGKLLIEDVKLWAKEKGNDTLSLRCNIKRTEAHLFYEHLDFAEVKQQKYFVIKL